LHNRSLQNKPALFQSGSIFKRLTFQHIILGKSMLTSAELWHLGFLLHPVFDHYHLILYLEMLLVD